MFDIRSANIYEIKKKLKEEKRKAARKAKEREEEKKERLLLGMEDYDVGAVIAEQARSEEFSEDVSLGGDSMYVYKNTREATPI